MAVSRMCYDQSGCNCWQVSGFQNCVAFIFVLKFLKLILVSNLSLYTMIHLCNFMRICRQRGLELLPLIMKRVYDNPSVCFQLIFTLIQAHIEQFIAINYIVQHIKVTEWRWFGKSGCTTIGSHRQGNGLINNNGKRCQVQEFWTVFSRCWMDGSQLHHFVYQWVSI